MEFLPIFLKSKDQRIAVVGGGVAAARKVDILMRSKCDITVYASELGAELHVLKTANKIEHCTDPVTVENLKGCIAAIGAAKNADENIALSELAKVASVPVNIVDNPPLCDFIMPATVDRSPIIIAVSSSGTTPLLARLLRSRIETAIPAAYGRLAEFAGSYRDRVKVAVTDGKRRLRFWEVMTNGPIAEHILAGKHTEATTLADRMLDETSQADETLTKGEVYLVGAGPGDPDLLTFRALRLMQQADVVLYDALLGDGILDMVRRDAERIYVGKKKDDHALPQEGISELLIRLAKEGKRVLRLKAGDPFTFGRGGEEIEALTEQAIAFQVVPGITAAHGCSSYSGIPLTHRDHAQSCTFVTGHVKDGKPNLNWETLVQPKQTVAIYMGLSS
ncbi:MAG: uroporphyrinogen-III C-methyltransferase, partial [Gammaproteobacteria bacterium]|nr:uroporphyrinogen-III C-methyltransferase [Gammaproteobacteria bacterium]